MANARANLEVSLGGGHLWLAGGLGTSGAAETATGGAFTSALLAQLRVTEGSDTSLPSLRTLGVLVADALRSALAEPSS